MVRQLDPSDKPAVCQDKDDPPAKTADISQIHACEVAASRRCGCCWAAERSTTVTEGCNREDRDHPRRSATKHLSEPGSAQFTRRMERHSFQPQHILPWCQAQSSPGG